MFNAPPANRDDVAAPDLGDLSSDQAGCAGGDIDEVEANRSACFLKERRVKRWEHEAVLDAMQERLDRAPKTMRIRRQTAEHPFGTIKAWMGATHFRLRTLEKVSAEMSLHVLAYNLKRMIAILGVQPLIQAMRAA